MFKKTTYMIVITTTIERVVPGRSIVVVIAYCPKAGSTCMRIEDTLSLETFAVSSLP